MFVRNPLDIPASAPVYDARTTQLFVETWYHYYATEHKALNYTLISHYESYCYQPEAELRRLFTLLNIEVEESNFSKAVDSITAQIEARNFTIYPYLITDEISQLHDELAHAAGNIYIEMQSDAEYLRQTWENWYRTGFAQQQQAQHQQKTELQQQANTLQQHYQTLLFENKMIQQQLDRLHTDYLNHIEPIKIDNQEAKSSQLEAQIATLRKKLAFQTKTLQAYEDHLKKTVTYVDQLEEAYFQLSGGKFNED